MAISIDYSGSPYRIIIPQADLTLISGDLYELDTETFRTDLIALEAAAQGMVFQNTHNHNTEVTIAGVTYARLIEILNSTNVNQITGAANTDEYEIFFDPDTQYSVRLAGSNNNIFDIENMILANNVTQIIPQNSAGLINPTLTAAEIAAAVWDALETAHTTAGSFGDGAAKTRKVTSNRLVVDRTNKDAIIYEDDETSTAYTIDPFPVDATDTERGEAK